MKSKKKKELNYEYEYLKNVVLILDKESWSTKDLTYIYQEYLKYLKKIKVDELTALRAGEVLLGKYCEVDYNINNVKDLIWKLLNQLSESSQDYWPICIAIIGTIVKISLAEINNEQLDFNNIKEETT